MGHPLHLFTENGTCFPETLKVGSMATEICRRGSLYSRGRKEAQEGSEGFCWFTVLVTRLVRPLGEKALVRSRVRKVRSGEGFGYRSGLSGLERWLIG